MVNEYFPEGKKPIDMTNYPYKVDQVLDNGIKVIAVIKGDDKDTFGGFLHRSIVDVKGMKRIHGKDIIFQSLGEAMNPAHPLRAECIDVEYVKTLGDPWMQRVYYRLPDDGGNEVCSPEQFLEIAKKSKGKEDTEKDTEKNICQGITKSGKSCKRSAVTGEDFCSAHLEG